ncbi:MAG: hypothetical protein EOM15_04830 [Spirochaetia bacterium]|nr:hypothetical protein [Spirochaetia bacterium]
MNSSNLMFTPIVLPLLGSALILMVKSFSSRKGRIIAEYMGSAIGLLLPLASLFVLYPVVREQGFLQQVVGSWDPSIGIMYRFDGLSFLMILLSQLISIPAWIYSRGRGPKENTFTALFLIQNASIAAISMCSDLFNLFVCLEVMGMTAYVLIASSKKNAAAFASFSYLLFSSTAMVFFLVGTYGLYRITGSLSYAGITTMIPEPNLMSSVCLVLITVSVLLRVAIMPLSFWLVPAHSKAPHAVSAMLSSVLLKIPLFSLVRILSLVSIGSDIGLVVSYAGAFTALFAVLLALSQKDAKQLLAYHSISQIGYITAAWGMALHAGVTSKTGAFLLSVAFFHALYHAMFKALLFLSVGTTTDYANQRNVYILRGANAQLRASGEKVPITMLCYFVGALSITAIPPFNGFFSKTLLTYALKETMQYTLLTLAGVGTLASFIKLSRIYLPAKPTGQEETKPFPKSIHIALSVLALFCIAGGVFAPQVFNFIKELLASHPEQEQLSFKFFTSSNLLKVLYTSLGGIVLFILAVSKTGTKLLSLLKNLPRSFSDAFFGFAVSIAILVYVLL